MKRLYAHNAAAAALALGFTSFCNAVCILPCSMSLLFLSPPSR